MKTLIIYTHPNPKSFNHSILLAVQDELLRKGHEIRIRDLYSEPFNPVLGATDFIAFSQGLIPDDIRREQQELLWADHLVFIYPVWWFERPALLKGWIDRVFSNGFAFTYGPQGAKGLLHHKKALVLQTAGNTEQELKQDNVLELLHKPMTEGTLRFCGIPDVQARTFGAVSKSTPEQYEVMLKEVREKWLREW